MEYSRLSMDETSCIAPRRKLSSSSKTFHTFQSITENWPQLELMLLIVWLVKVLDSLRESVTGVDRKKY